MHNQDTKPANAKSQASVTPSEVLGMLKEGNQRFLNNETLIRDTEHAVRNTSEDQWPYAIILSCIDSRVPAEILFDSGIGDLFNARIAGNFVNSDILGSMEFACKVAGAKLVLVMGHTGCGGVKGACDHIEMGHITEMCRNIYPAVDATHTKEGEKRNSGNTDFVNRVAEKNVALTIQTIQSKSQILRELSENGEIDVVGAMYDVGSGKVEFYD